MRNSPATLTNTTRLQQQYCNDATPVTIMITLPPPTYQPPLIKHNQKIMYNSNKLYYKGVKQYNRDIRYNVVYYKGVKPISWLGNGLNIRTIIYY